jgi:hypothetical protein
MIHITTSFLALLSLSGAALGSVAQIKADLANMATAVITLDTAIANFPSTGGTAAEALVRFVACFYCVHVYVYMVCRLSTWRP